MNREHLALCSSAEWAEAVQRWIIPWVLEAVDLGDDVLEVGPGPGLTTDVLRTKVTRLTAVESTRTSLRRWPPGWRTRTSRWSAPTPPELRCLTGGSAGRCA
jgi:hypothetical protein